MIPRAADVVSLDAYRGNHAFIQTVMINVKMTMVLNWKMAMDELKHTCSGQEINFPALDWDWNVRFFDELPVGSWAMVKLRYRSRNSNSDEEQDGNEGDEQNQSAGRTGVPVLDKLLD